MTIHTLLDPVEGLKESTANEILTESTISQVLRALKRGQELDIRYIGELRDDEGNPMAYEQALRAIPSRFLTDRFKTVLRSATAGRDSRLGTNVLGQRVVR